MALWRRRRERNGAEPVGNTHDVIEGLALRPPVDAAAATRLANEQHAYCDDIVSQGVGSIVRLAALPRRRSA